MGEWSAKDLIAHLIGWDFTNLAAVQEILDGRYPGFFQYYDKDWRSYNARLVEEYKVEPFSALLVEVEDSHHQLVSFLEASPAEQVVGGKARNITGRTISIRSLLRYEGRDEIDHASQVRAFTSG
jgi:hypothetical protein